MRRVSDACISTPIEFDGPETPSNGGQRHDLSTKQGKGGKPMNETFAVKIKRDTQIDVTGAGDNWIILPKASVAVTDGSATIVHESAIGSVLDFYGSITTTAHFIAVDLLASDVTVTVASTGSIRSPQVTALHLAGNSSDVENAGVIRGALGVWSAGDDNTLVNSGSILGRDGAVYSSGDDFYFVNKGVVHAAGTAIVNNADANAAMYLNNYGDILSTTSSTAIEGGAGADTFEMHRGHVGGDVLLGDCTDVFKFFGGKIDGYVSGGISFDIYELHRAVKIREDMDGGSDEVNSYISWHLGKNFEDLDLEGYKDINATGNNLDNRIAGNASDNVIVGGTGDDTLLGEGGNDRLLGGSGIDMFYYSTDTMRILDFDAKGADHDNLKIDAVNSGLHDWFEVHGAMYQKGDDVIIKAQDGDRCILEAVDTADITPEMISFILV
jgi:Ca2+-binding RTX toxin-like protein